MICQFQLATLQNVETFRGEYLCKPLYIVYIAFIFPHSQDVINMNNVSNLDSQFPLITCNPQLSLPCIIFFGVIQETFKIISISCGKKTPSCQSICQLTCLFFHGKTGMTLCLC